MGRLFISGDIHGNLGDIRKIKKFCEENNTTTKDALILLGDVGANYWLNQRDLRVKEALASCPITFLCVHGNHEERAENVFGYIYIESKQYGPLYYEYDFPNIYFLKDGEHIINKNRFLVVGGAYSPDKLYRFINGQPWFSSEQLNDAQKQEIREIVSNNNSFDYILTHTAPLNYEPKYLFLPMIDQSTIDKSMEIFLQEIYDSINLDTLKYWCFGHYHDDNLLDKKIRLMYDDIIQIE